MTTDPITAPPALAYLRDQLALGELVISDHFARIDGAAGVLALARDLLTLCSETAAGLERLAPAKTLACRAGCDRCCHQLIKVRPIFAVLALVEAQRIFPPAQWAQLAERLTNGSAFCPFLFDGACSIYHVRPMVCRGYYSLDYQACESGDYCEKSLGYQSDGAHAAHLQMVFLFALEKRLEQLEAEQGLEQGAVFLDAAIRTLLTTPAAVRRWLAGEIIFSEPDQPATVR